MIISNLYKKNQTVVHIVIHEKLLPPIVYTIATPRHVIYWRIRITHCKAIKIHATNSVCQTNKLYKNVTNNVKISLIVTVIKAETESDKLSDIFFQPVRNLMKAKGELKLRSWRYCLCKHGTCAHKCPLDREFPLPITHLDGGKPLRIRKGELYENKEQHDKSHAER